MTNFITKMKASFPAGITLPVELERLFEWMEANDFVESDDERTRARLYPRRLAHEINSNIWLSPDYIGWWHNTDPIARFAPFVKTGSDGSYAGLWLDDEGRQLFVHFPSGSGSTMCCVLAGTAIDFLRLLAIGYEELCWPEDYQRTPEELHEEKYDSEVEPYMPPLLFQAWVEKTFGVEIPKTASEIVTSTPSMLDEDSDDPFWKWMKQQQGW
jgi:hypothetical protein